MYQSSSSANFWQFSKLQRYFSLLRRAFPRSRNTTIEFHYFLELPRLISNSIDIHIFRRWRLRNLLEKCSQRVSSSLALVLCPHPYFWWRRRIELGASALTTGVWILWLSKISFWFPRFKSYSLKSPALRSSPDWIFELGIIKFEFSPQMWRKRSSALTTATLN